MPAATIQRMIHTRMRIVLLFENLTPGSESFFYRSGKDIYSLKCLSCIFFSVNVNLQASFSGRDKTAILAAVVSLLKVDNNTTTCIQINDRLSLFRVLDNPLDRQASKR